MVYISRNADRLLLLMFVVYIIMRFYYDCLRQSILAGHTPQIVLAIPFLLGGFFIFRLSTRYTKNIPETRLLLYMLFYFATSLFLSKIFFNIEHKYNTYIYCIFYPLAFFYFIKVFRSDIQLSEIIIRYSPVIYILISLIYLYFIPLSYTDKGNYGSLNTAYYILLLYPLCMLNKTKYIRILTTCSTILIVFLSMKRGGIVAVVVGFIIYYICRGFYKKNNIFNSLLNILIISIAIYSLFQYVDFISDGYISERLITSIDGSKDESRTTIYQNVINAISSGSVIQILLGHGADTTRLLSYENYTAHNDFLEFFYNYGIIGLSLLIALHIFMIKSTKKTIKNNIQNNMAFVSVYSYTSILILSNISHVFIMGYFLIVILIWSIIFAHNTHLNNI